MLISPIYDDIHAQLKAAIERFYANNAKHLWAVAGEAIPEMKDYAQKRLVQKKISKTIKMR